MGDNPLAVIDADLIAVWCDRQAARLRLSQRDDTINREVYKTLCADMDALLELRHELVRAS